MAKRVTPTTATMDLFAASTIDELTTRLCASIATLPLSERVDRLNMIRRALHAVSPFAGEPVDCIEWVSAGAVRANDYNPNSVAPPEMRLLAHSIRCDGYTQPIVGWPVEDEIEVVDGFHRNRVGKEDPEVRERIHGYLPVVRLRADRGGRGDRQAATIRHNRARGKHAVKSMAQIVADMRLAGWSEEQIAKEMGMEAEEVLRLQQIKGLRELFKDRDYSEAWEATRGDVPARLLPADGATDGERKIDRGARNLC